MAYETGVATSQQDLLSKLGTFASGNGWTQDEFDTTNKRLSLHKGTIYVQFRWDAVDAISMYHSLGFIGTGTSPGNHTDDSGNGQTAANPLTTGRRVNRIGNGPFTAYYFFTNSSPADYIHVVLEFSPGLFRHVTFGKLVKNGTWTGGEFAGCEFIAASSTGLDNTSHYVLCDGRHDQDNTLPMTIHVEGLPGQTAGTKWGIVWGPSTNLGTDRGGAARNPLIGGLRESFLQAALGWFSANPNNGFVPMFPLQIFRRRLTSPEQWINLGTIPDLRYINIKFVNAADEFTVGGDTWKCFPWVKKTTTANADESGNMGIAIRKT